MKSTRKFLLLGLALLPVACHNMKPEFEDFGMTTVCFPYQTPARTLILGNYEQGLNENDNNHCFEMGVTLSGLYQNKENRYVHFEVAPPLLTGVTNVIALPSDYYEIQTKNPVLIPKGEIKGRIKVHLTDKFFADARSIAPKNQVNYVIPVKISGVENIDSVLVGTPAVANPVRTKLTDWIVAPKDYVLFGIKYVNPYDGYFLRRGADKISDTSGRELGLITYHQKYVENDELVRTRTESFTCAVVPCKLRHLDKTVENMNIKMNFNSGSECEVTDASGVKIGIGKYLTGGDKWGGKARDVIYLKYAFKDAILNQLHSVCDTLVMRDRDIVFEKFTLAF